MANVSAWFEAAPILKLPFGQTDEHQLCHPIGPAQRPGVALGAQSIDVAHDLADDGFHQLLFVRLLVPKERDGAVEQ